MRAVLAHARGSDVRELRRILLGAGLDCAAEDCVAWNELPIRLAQHDTDVVIMQVESGRQYDWSVIRDAASLTSAPVLAVGPKGYEEGIQQARQAGVVDYLNEAELRQMLDGLLDRLIQAGRIVQSRGTVISVFAPMPGSGGSTVAANLAGEAAKSRPQQVALVELARDGGDLSLLLNVAPQFAAKDVCERWQHLDTLSLANCFMEHPCGLKLLVNAGDQSGNPYLGPEAVRRIAVLSRIMYRTTVLALESRLDSEQFEAMRLSDIVTMIIRPDVPSVRRTCLALTAAEGEGVSRDRFRLIVNRWGQRGQLTAKQVESTLGLKAISWISDDPSRVNKAANRGALLQDVAPHSGIRRRFVKLAAALQGT